MATPDSKIIIVGAGVFGLSTALWLAKSGYKHITVFDSCPLDKKNYNPADGCDGASADINKVFRTAYGVKRHYQDLALEAQEIWLSWNEAIQESSPFDLPQGLTPEDKLLDLCGIYFLSAGIEMDAFHKESLEAIDKAHPESRRLRFVKGSAEDEDRLRRLHPKWIKPFHILDALDDNETNGFLDIQGGINLADKACTYARFLCEQAGVKFILGTAQGRLESLIASPQGKDKKVTGIKTCDGLEHFGDIVVIACGGWTASIIPEAHRTVEATGGTVLFIDVPKDREDIWEKFDPKNYPAWAYRQGGDDVNFTGGNFTGGFPITREGRLKFVFRGRKYTNFQDHPTESNLRVSTPRTKYTHNPIHTVPLHGLQLAKEIVGKAFPELAEFGFTDTRICWYTDSIDNEFVIDYVPGYSNSLFICSGGSGHGFKFLPILGRVKNQLERVPDQFTQFWKWRVAEQDKNCNGLEQGEYGPRELSRNEMAKPHDLSFSNTNDHLHQEPIQQQTGRQTVVAA